MDEELIEPLRSSPVAAVLRMRLSRRVDHALVAEDSQNRGTFRVKRPRRSATVRPPFGTWLSLGDVLGRSVTRIFRVDLAEHLDTMHVPLPDGPDGPLVASMHVAWRVHDPATLVRCGLTDPTPAVRRALRKRAAEHLDTTSTTTEQHTADTDEVAVTLQSHLGDSEPLPDAGVTYRVGYIVVEPGVPTDPESRPHPSKREEYAFYRDVVSEGMPAVVALWLMQDTDTAKPVLDWMEARPPMTSPKEDFDRGVAALFTGLEDVERDQVRRAVSLTLRKFGHDEELLHYVDGADGHAGPSSLPNGAASVPSGEEPRG